MSNIHKDDIVEFFYENGELGFGFVIEVHQTNAIDALYVADIVSHGKIIMIPAHHVKDTWRNLKGYVTDCQILQDEVKRLKEENERMRNELIKIKRIADDYKHRNCDFWQKNFWYALASEIGNVLAPPQTPELWRKANNDSMD